MFGREERKIKVKIVVGLKRWLASKRANDIENFIKKMSVLRFVERDF